MRLSDSVSASREGIELRRMILDICDVYCLTLPMRVMPTVAMGGASLSGMTSDTGLDV